MGDKTVHNFKRHIDLSTDLAFSSSRGEVGPLAYYEQDPFGFHPFPKVLCICLLPVDGGLLDLRGLLAHRRLEEAEGHHRPSEGESVKRRNAGLDTPSHAAVPRPKRGEFCPQSRPKEHQR